MISSLYLIILKHTHTHGCHCGSVFGKKTLYTKYVPKINHVALDFRNRPPQCHLQCYCFQPFSAITLNSNHVMLDFGLNDRREKLINKHYLLCSQSGLSGFYFSKKRLMGLGSRI